MNINDIPVRVVGPGSQPVSDADTLTYMDMPGGMDTFVAPIMPEPEQVMHLAGAREAMQWLQEALTNSARDGESRFANLSLLDDESRELVNQVLGEGEISITCDGPSRSRTQESVLAGVWRTFYYDADDKVVFDLLEVAYLPQVVGAAGDVKAAVNTSADGVPAELSNALPILVELASHCDIYARDSEPHSINLSLLPLSDAELEFLDERLGRGPVDILSRAYGKCQVISTNTANAWWVRYYNSMDTLILNTLEVVQVPQVVAAAPEDLADSVERLAQILKPYWTEVA